jgi:hypothetical protein
MYRKLPALVAAVSHALGTDAVQATPSQQQQGFQQRIKRVVQSQTFLPGGVLTFQMPRNYDAESIYILIQGSVSYPAALVAACVRGDAPYNLLNKVELIVEGRQTLFSVPGYVLGMNNMRRHKRQTYRERVESFAAHQQFPLVYTAPTSTMPVSTTVNFSGQVCIDLQNIAGYRPKDSNLRTGGMQTFDLRLTCGQLTDLFYPAAASATPFAAAVGGAVLPTLTGYVLNATTVTVCISELQELAGTDGKISSPTTTFRWSNQTINVSANNSNLEVPLPTDNFVANCFLVSKISGDSQDGIIQNVILRRGVDVRYNLPIGTIQALNQQDYDWSFQPGHYAIDLATAGNNNLMMSQAWNLQGGADTRIGLNVVNSSTTTTIDVTTCEIIPLRQG